MLPLLLHGGHLLDFLLQLLLHLILLLYDRGIRRGCRLVAGSELAFGDWGREDLFALEIWREG
jgi:hypothetical protein